MRLIKAILALVLLALAVSATAQTAMPNTTTGGTNQMTTYLGGLGSKAVMKIPIRDTTSVWTNVSDSGRITIQPSTGNLYWHNGHHWVTVSADLSGYIQWGDTTATIATKSDINSIGLQEVLDVNNVADTGIFITDYTNTDPVSGVSKYSTLLSRTTKTDPDSVAVGVQLNDRWVLNSTPLYPIYGVQLTPKFTLNDSANSRPRYQGIISNINLDSNKKGSFRTAHMFVSGGHFGYPGVRVEHYAGMAVHVPVIWDSADYVYGIKMGGFNSPNFKNATSLFVGTISGHIDGKWDIYLSQHNHKNNYLGDSITMIGLPTSVRIHPTARTQTLSLASSGLMEYTSNIRGSYTNLTVVDKGYTDSLYTISSGEISNKIPYSDTLNRLIPTKKYVDSVVTLYLLANGATIDVNGRLILPAGMNGGIKVNDALYLQPVDTQSTSGGTIRAALSGYYTHTSGQRGIMQAFGTYTVSSGTGIYTAYSSNIAVNQTGTASGITSAYLANNPSGTQVDFRAFRAANTSGTAFYNESGNARNIFLGETQIGSATDAGAYQLQVAGASLLTGTLTLSSSSVGLNQSNALSTNNFEGATSFTTGITTGSIYQNSISKVNRFRGITTFDTTIEIKNVPAYTTGGNVSLVRNTTTDSIEYIIPFDYSGTALNTGTLTITSPETFRFVNGGATITITPSFAGQIFRLHQQGAGTTTIQMTSGNIDGGASTTMNGAHENKSFIWDGTEAHTLSTN